MRWTLASRGLPGVRLGATGGVEQNKGEVKTRRRDWEEAKAEMQGTLKAFSRPHRSSTLSSMALQCRVMGLELFTPLCSVTGCSFSRERGVTLGTVTLSSQGNSKGDISPLVVKELPGRCPR